MKAPPASSGVSPAWLLLIGLLAGGAFIVFMLGDTFMSPRVQPTHKNVVVLTDANWSKEVASSEIPVLVDVWAPWCDPCVKLGPTIDSLAEEYAGKVKVGKLNADDNAEIVAKYKVRSLPCVMLFSSKNEAPREVLVGLRSHSDYVRAINAILAEKSGR
jgi:thioredoxin 1